MRRRTGVRRRDGAVRRLKTDDIAGARYAWAREREQARTDHAKIAVSDTDPQTRTERKQRRRAARDQGATVTGLRHARVLAALAAAGVLLTAYLTAAYWLEATLPFCAAGSSCEVVRGSRWSVLFGIPLPAWGLAGYALLAALLWRSRRSPQVWPAAFSVTFVAWTVSVYYTAIAGIELGAFCGWCLLSLGLLTALLAGLALARPQQAPVDTRWRVWLPAGALLALTASGIVHLYHAGVFDPAAGPEDPYLRALAEHLAASGAHFYGAYWCPHCEDQKELFGASAHRLPYVECSPHGRRGPRATECVAAGIGGYPTWIIGGRRFERVLTPEQLARYSGYRRADPPPER